MKVEEVKALGRALLVSRANVNNCSTLLSFISSSLAQSTTSSSSSPLSDCLQEAIRCLQAFFLPILSSEDWDKNANGTETAEAIYRTWLKDKYREFTQLLIKIVVEDGQLPLQIAALDALMELIQGKNGGFSNGTYFKLCAGLVGTRNFNETILEMLVTKYLEQADICYLTVVNLEKLVNQRYEKQQKGKLRMTQGCFFSCNSGEEALSSDDDGDKVSGHGVSVHTFVRNTYGIMSQLSPLVRNALKNGSTVEQVDEYSKGKPTGGTREKDNDGKKMRLKMKRFWQSFLQLPLPLDVYKKVLADMSKIIIPTMSNPIRLSDFLTKSYDMGGLFSIMALDGLYVLITKHGLEYPDFYDKLYALLEPSMFFTKYRTRFFELMDSCLKSPLLSAYLAAAFAKKLSLLSLSASPAGALLVIAMIHNLLRRHPSINCLVHRNSSVVTPEDVSITGTGECIKDGEEIFTAKPGRDPFIANDTKTSECNALKSSLWEIESLRRHYCPPVSRFVTTLEADLTVRANTTEVQISDFSSGSYSTIFHEETRRRLKQVPLAYYKVIPSTLFPEGVDSEDSFGGWSFCDKRADLDSSLDGKKRKFTQIM